VPGAQASPTPADHPLQTRTPPMSPSPATTGPRRFLAIGLLPLAGILAAACSSGTGSATPTTNATATTAPSTPATTAGPQAVVKTMTVSGLGSILVNAQGQVLYS